MSYDFSTLLPADFEDLVRDLLGRELGIRFEAFTAGPDGGIDGRHASGAKSTILQAKHYRGSSFSDLKKAMKKERKSIDKLAPSRYLLATSRGLTPGNKSTLADIIGLALQTEADIYGPDELNALLRTLPEIEKAHIKLWLSGTAVLERIVHSALHNFTEISKRDIEETVKVYAQNPSFAVARDKLEDHHVLIVSGPPGVGKTTLAEMLSYAYIAEEWEFVAIRSLDDGFASIVDAKKQIFFFDDFLGTIALDKRALASKDSGLARFIRRVRKSPNARFILTTRAYIFEEARRMSEHLADQRLDISKYLLDVGVYTRQIRARILYNHLFVAGTSQAYVVALIESGKIPAIVDHKNYNPRVIEWMTDTLHIGNVKPEDYPDEFLARLANPSRLWDTAFRTHIAKKCQHLLFSLFFSSPYGVEINELRVAYNALHPSLCEKYGEPHDPKDFEESLRILEGGFIAISGTEVQFINPSLRDYLSEYLNDLNMLRDFATTSRTGNWAREIWRHGIKTGPNADTRRSFALAFQNITREFTRLPVWRRVPHGAGYALSANDMPNSARISLLIDWWQASRNDEFSTIALAVAENPVEGMNSWRDGSDVVELISKLRDDDYYEDLPNASALAETLESALITMLRQGMPSDELETISDAIEEWKYHLSDEILSAAGDAIENEVRNVDDIVAGIDSDSTLEDHIKALERLAPRASVSSEALSRAISTIQGRIDEIEEQTTVSSSPSFTGIQPDERDTFGDTALQNLFMPLLSR